VDIGKPSLDLLLLAIGLATGLATLAGGVMALRFRSARELFLGFSSGAVIGVALFDLLPEALALGPAHRPLSELTTAVAIGFAIYFLVDRITLLSTPTGGGHRGHLGAASLTLHSLMDGLGIGLAFQVSPAAGAIVGVAVLAHDLIDGLNTVTLSLSGGNGPVTARRWLVADALAPLIGIGLSRLVVAPQASLAVALALFAGFFLYIGASELLPQTHDRRPHVSTIAATLGGLALIYAVVRLAGG
jgi:ZIP family zinc transporter